eukprot:g10666.t1
MVFKGRGKRIRAAGLITLSLLVSLVMPCNSQTEEMLVPPLETFPSVANSTILFLHGFKCGGTSLRQVFMSLAEANGWSGAVVPGCKRQEAVQFYDPPGSSICITRENQLVDQERGKWLVGGTKVLAGHFLWDFRTYVTQPYLLITTLRNPLELFVSGQQFKNREETSTLQGAASFVENKMRDRLTWTDPFQLGYIRGFLDNKAANNVTNTNAPIPDPEFGSLDDQYLAVTRTAEEHLSTFFLVGVVEQYEGFIHVLRQTMDPELEHPSIWQEALEIRNNRSPVQSKDVLNNIDQDIVQRYNDTMGYHWKFYEFAVKLWDARCREVLPVSDHERLCTVPGHA